MMYFAASAAFAYLGGAYLASALLVRFVPRCYTSRQIRKNLVLFMVMPLLLVVDILTSIDALRRISHAVLCTSFELLSGRRLLTDTPISLMAASARAATVAGPIAARRFGHAAAGVRASGSELP